MRTVQPRTDIYKENDAVHVYLEMPGVAKEDVEVKVEDSKLIIEASRASGEENEKYLHRGRRTGTYRKAYALEDEIDTESISAQLENGLLHVTLAFKPETQPRKIKVA